MVGSIRSTRVGVGAAPVATRCLTRAEEKSNAGRRQDRREDQVVSPVGECDVLLHLRGLFWALRSRSAAGDAEWKNGAARADHAGRLVGNLAHDGHPER